MLNFGGNPLAKATKAVVAAEGSLREAEARRAKVRERLATAKDGEVEELATEAAKVDALAAAYTARLAAAQEAKAKAEAEAMEADVRAAEEEAEAACHRVRDLGEALTARARAFAAELLEGARLVHEEAAKGRAAKYRVPPSRQEGVPDATGSSPWVGAIYGGPSEVLRAASNVLARGG